ncbi:MAG TPA: hypothetical protein ENK60_06815 [Anaerolineae bacterium]|nr:hypothetical protein [Anaerolineae bacterium]
MTDAPKAQSQVSPEEDPVLLAKKRAAERIKARFHHEERHTMNFEKAHQWFQKEKALEKKHFSKESQLQRMEKRLIYIAPRSTITKLIQEKQAA